MTINSAESMNLASARKILLCLRFGIGDLVMEMPALDALVRHCPQGRLVLLGARPAIELLEGDPRVDRLLCVQDLGFGHWGDFGTPELRAQVIAWMARENFDVILDPGHAVLGIREAIWARRGHILDAGGDLQEAALAAGLNGQGAVTVAVREGWGIDLAPTSVPSLHLQPIEIEFAAEFLRAHGVGDGAIAISPVASSPLKRWPVERFALLADHLSSLSGEKCIVFTGPQQEIGHAVQQAMRYPERMVLVGPLHLRQVAAVLAACRAFVGNDTGLMHLAATVGTPLVALFGPTSPDIYLPAQVPAVALGGRDGCPWRRTAMFGPPECVVHGVCFVGRRSCIDDIDGVSVAEAMATLLRREEGSKAPAERIRLCRRPERD